LAGARACKIHAKGIYGVREDLQEGVTNLSTLEVVEGTDRGFTTQARRAEALQKGA
jgi:hypothetical protein